MPNIDQVQLPDGSQYNLKDNVSNYVTAGYVDDAIDALTKADVGLGNVDNTSDLNKPVSTAQQTALNGKTDTTVIAPTEATTTASRRYEIGEQFILNGVLYTATAVIASGDTIIVDTNCELSESITEQIIEIDAKTSGLSRMTKLWENPSPTASFAAQNITLSSDDYDMLLGIAWNVTNVNRAISVCAYKGMGFVFTVCGPGVNNVAATFIRPVDRVNDTTFSVYNCYTAGTGTGGSTTDNSSLIPYIIYGIKLI